MKKEWLEIKDFIKKHTKKHLCKCGCRRYIKIRSNHQYEGIPNYIKGHHPRRKKLHEATLKFIEHHTGKYKCKCNCGNYIKIKKAHKYAGIPKFILGHHKKYNPKRKWKQ